MILKWGDNIQNDKNISGIIGGWRFSKTKDSSEYEISQDGLANFIGTYINADNVGGNFGHIEYNPYKKLNENDNIME